MILVEGKAIGRDPPLRFGHSLRASLAHAAYAAGRPHIRFWTCSKTTRGQFGSFSDVLGGFPEILGVLGRRE